MFTTRAPARRRPPTLLAGAIASITVIDPGSDYTAPRVTITGNGTGAAATANLGALTGGIRKFIDSLAGLGPTGASTVSADSYIPIAGADTTTFPGCDYYEIELEEYEQQFHRDLPPTRLRGYRQTNGPTPDAKPHYLGPLIVANRGTPVRIKFTNNLPTGAGGNLFIPVDTTVMGAGMGPLDMPGMPGMKEDYTQNRATLHLHGGLVPWISDGTPHQWTTPAGETTQYPKGVSVQYVPDMWFDAGGNRDSWSLSDRTRGRRDQQPRPWLADLLLQQPAERPADVLPRPCLRHHPPQRLRRRSRGLPDHRPG